MEKSTVPETRVPDSLSIGKIFLMSAREFTKVRTLVTTAMLIALCCGVGMLAIPLSVFQIKFTYLIYAVGGMLYGPVVGAVIGIGDQIIAETLLKGNAPLFGYIVSFALRGMLFGLFLYYPVLQKAAKGVSYLRLSLLKACDTVFYNIVINTFLLYHYKFIVADSLFVAISARILKNVVMLPVEIFLLAVFLRALIPACVRLNLMPPVGIGKVTRSQVAVSAVLAVVGAAAMIVFIVFYSSGK